MHGRMPKRAQEAALAEFRVTKGGPRVMLLTDVALQGRDGLQRASYVFQLSHNYTPGRDVQLYGRIHRFNQTERDLFAVKVCAVLSPLTRPHQVILAGTEEMHVHSINDDKGRGQTRLLQLASEAQGDSGS